MTEETRDRLFVLDTNVLMHDPGSIFRFQEHDLFIPMMVLEELDAAKKGMSEVSRNVRQVSRFLDELITEADSDAIEKGLPLSSLSSNNGNTEPHGKLFLQTNTLEARLPANLPGKNPQRRHLHPDPYLAITPPLTHRHHLIQTTATELPPMYQAISDKSPQ